MKKFLFFALVLLTVVSCTKQPKGEEEKPGIQEESAKVMVYYFHGKQRCKSCVAIQQIAQETLKEKYSDNEDVKFVEVDFSEKENDALAEKYEVAWSSLIIVHGETFTNMTDEAFTKALSDAAGLKTSIEQVVNGYLAQK